MRKLIVCNIMSLDGYYEGPGKNVRVRSGVLRRLRWHPTENLVGTSIQRRKVSTKGNSGGQSPFRYDNLTGWLCQ